MSALNAKIKRNKIKIEYREIIENLIKCKRLCCEMRKKKNAENGSKMLENLEIQKTLYVIKTFNVANEQILEKTISQNYLFWIMVHQRGFNPIYHVPFFKFCVAKLVTCHKFAIHHFQLLPKFLRISSISKNME